MKAEGLYYILKAYDICEKKGTHTKEADMERYTHQILRALKKIDAAEIDKEYLPILNRILDRK